ncbi:hypothetical protein BD289DRAFT_115109 [Coniella lustricola]|uniref:Uncharacterized protein n=1 Tax=Coniella lustricola TaxID=2025994 RepID=A0A2T2ZX09_9PEZI|nr:hypothetical protein BD289DRAFT_115109 [Coniella lustricola]
MAGSGHLNPWSGPMWKVPRSPSACLQPLNPGRPPIPGNSTKTPRQDKYFYIHARSHDHESAFSPHSSMFRSFLGEKQRSQNCGSPNIFPSGRSSLAADPPSRPRSLQAPTYQVLQYLLPDPGTKPITRRHLSRGSFGSDAAAAPLLEAIESKPPSSPLSVRFLPGLDARGLFSSSVAILSLCLFREQSTEIAARAFSTCHRRIPQ